MSRLHFRCLHTRNVRRLVVMAERNLTAEEPNKVVGEKVEELSGTKRRLEEEEEEKDKRSSELDEPQSSKRSPALVSDQKQSKSWNRSLSSNTEDTQSKNEGKGVGDKAEESSGNKQLEVAKEEVTKNDKKSSEDELQLRNPMSKSNEPKQSKWFPWLWNRSMSSNAEDTQSKKYWQGLELEEKRKHYRCEGKYVTLDEIDTWDKFHQTAVLPLPPAGEDAKFSPNISLNGKVSLWSGDITRLEIDAIVNAANSSLMGGGGVDGAIHRAAGGSLKKECADLGRCATGDAKLSTGHRLPAKFIIHTVGPMDSNAAKLQSCYKKCLEIVSKNNLKSVAFCCIATGVYGFPNKQAASIALGTVREWLDTEGNADKVDRIIFTVFLKKDYKIYSSLLQVYFPIDPVAAAPQMTTTNTVENVIPSLEKHATEPARGLQYFVSKPDQMNATESEMETNSDSCTSTATQPKTILTHSEEGEEPVSKGVEPPSNEKEKSLNTKEEEPDVAKKEPASTKVEDLSEKDAESYTAEDNAEMETDTAAQPQTILADSETQTKGKS